MPDRKLTLEYVDPDRLRGVWDRVKQGLYAVRNNSADCWIVEDVYMALKANSSTLHIGYLDGEYKGFLILTPTASYDGPVLHIWATYSAANDFCVFTEGIEQIKAFAKHMNAKRITFLSPRKGWEKHGERLGFSPRTTEFAMEVL